MSLVCHRLPPPPWFPRPVPAAHGSPAAGHLLCVAASHRASNSAAVCAAIPADRVGVLCSSQAGLSPLAQRSALCVLGFSVPERPEAAVESRRNAVTAGGSRTTTSRAHRPAALPSDATNISAEARDSTAALIPETSVGGGGASDGGSAGGGDGEAGGGGGGGDGAGRGGSDGAGDESPERPPVGSLLLVPLAATAVLGARWALARQRGPGAHAGAAPQESVNRSGIRCWTLQTTCPWLTTPGAFALHLVASVHDPMLAGTLADHKIGPIITDQWHVSERMRLVGFLLEHSAAAPMQELMFCAQTSFTGHRTLAIDEGEQSYVACCRSSIQALKRLQRETFEALVGVRSRLLALEVRFAIMNLNPDHASSPKPG